MRLFVAGQIENASDETEILRMNIIRELYHLSKSYDDRFGTENALCVGYR